MIAAPRRLETCGNSVIRIVPERCKSRLCSVCGPRRGYRLRRRIADVSGLFAAPVLVSLTVDRRRVVGSSAWTADQAFDYVTGKRLVSRLMGAVGVERFLWVVEFQRKTGDGWPHWHILIDASQWGGFVPLRLVKKMWRLWRDRWLVGGLDIRTSHRWENREHAINYITKYLTKPPEGGWPAWVLRRSNVRLVGGSRAVGALVGSRGAKESAAEPEEGDARPKRAAFRRLARCGSSTRFVQFTLDPKSGQEFGRLVGVVPVGVSLLLPLGPAAIVEEDNPLPGGRSYKSYRGGEAFSVADVWQRINAEYLEDYEEFQCLMREAELLRAWASRDQS